MRSTPALPAALASIVIAAPPAFAGPPGTPTAVKAAAQLAALTVADESHASTYDRKLFPHWSTVSGECNSRETVLKRDGIGVVTNSNCSATSGSWYSPYDGAIWTAAGDLDIDHMVPLSEAWKSGAYAWTPQKRKSFTNDLDGPQLWTVTDNVNQAKGDKDPAAWRPPLASIHCVYAKSWIAVKHTYGLTLQASEKSALEEMLATC